MALITKDHATRWRETLKEACSAAKPPDWAALSLRNKEGRPLRQKYEQARVAARRYGGSQHVGNRDPGHPLNGPHPTD